MKKHVYIANRHIYIIIPFCCAYRSKKVSRPVYTYIYILLLVLTNIYLFLHTLRSSVCVRPPNVHGLNRHARSWSRNETSWQWFQILYKWENIVSNEQTIYI